MIQRGYAGWTSSHFPRHPNLHARFSGAARARPFPHNETPVRPIRTLPRPRLWSPVPNESTSRVEEAEAPPSLGASGGSCEPAVRRQSRGPSGPPEILAKLTAITASEVYRMKALEWFRRLLHSRSPADAVSIVRASLLRKAAAVPPVPSFGARCGKDICKSGRHLRPQEI